MPANRVPTKIMDLRGAFKVHPERKRERENEPQPTEDIGAPPKGLSRSEKACWREIVKNSPPGVLKNSDRVALEMLSCLLAEFRIQKTLFKAAKLAQLNSLLGRFGYTPSDRSKVYVEPPPKKNKYADDWD